MTIRRLRARRADGVTLEQLDALESRITDSEVRRELFESVLLEVRQGIVIVGADDEVMFMNPQSTKLIRPATTLQQLTPHSLQSLVRLARSESASIEQELEVGRPARAVQVAASPVEGGGVVLILNDVTESRRIEAVRRDFVAAASHELKTPVSSILASAEALQLALAHDPSAAKQFADQVEASARQLANLVGDLLDLSRLESKPEYDEELALDEVVAAEVGSFAERAEQAGISLRTETVPVTVRGSRSDLSLALRNLLDNALRHTSSGGQVTVAVTQIENAAMLEVIDTGEGIASRELPRIFERFYRVDSARSRATGGTGLGLAIVRHVVEAHGGTIEVSSTLGEGSTFSIRLNARP
ncbi:MAG: GHKL domain-containing protein [Acidimicrobiia bacterium]|nr:GHKL domain-containing protein [Acidimicrobiia bacterium]